MPIFMQCSYSISISAGAMMLVSSLAVKAGKIDLGRAPPFVTQSAARGRRGRDVADEPDDVRVARGRLGGRAFDAVDHRLECDIAREGVAALVVKLADGRAHLVVGVRGDILHQEIHQAGIPLEDGQNLQRAVGRRPRRGGRFGRYWLFAARQFQNGKRVRGKRAVKEDLEEAAKRQKNAIQIGGSRVSG